jgi:hypothetical protein
MGHRLFLFDGHSVIDINIEDLDNVTATEHDLNFLVDKAVFDPSGNTFAAKTDFDIRILDANTFEEKDSLPYGDVQAMRFTPDGKFLLLVLRSRMVILWDVAAGYAIEELMLDLDSGSVLSADITNSCRVLPLNDESRSACIIRLSSWCYWPMSPREPRTQTIFDGRPAFLVYDVIGLGKTSASPEYAGTECTWCIYLPWSGASNARSLQGIFITRKFDGASADSPLQAASTPYLLDASP